MAKLIRSAPLLKYAQVAGAANLDVARLFRHVGADLECMVSPDLFVPGSWLTNVLEASDRQTGFGSVGLLIAKAWKMSDFGRLGLLMQHQPTLREALRQFELYRHLRSEAVTLDLHEAGATAVIQLRLHTERARAGRHTVELSLGTLMPLLRTFLGPQWRPLEARFAHRAPRDRALHEQVFGCPVEFGCGVDAIVVDRRDLDRPNPLADALFSAYALELVQQQHPGGAGSNASNVRRTLEVLLPQGRGGIADVGARLGLSPRTLQRRLEQEGTDFSALVGEVRRGLATRHMNDLRHPISQVAALVGFSDASAFSRWFSAQFGLSPKSWRLDRSKG